MGKPAARVGDMHVCPMVTPGLPPVPHVGGPILPPGTVTVLIGGQPAACMGDMCTCVGPPDSIILGSMTVLIGGKPAARMGDTTVHGGTITLGCPTVLIGG
ncbi:PAAR domain-containing protein [Spirosoma terrae]|uniref:Type VI secretion protein n=1 Tax=Spirosoma terrae TaxID=1968276 RepID=A0A6L9LE03_9BACT|nr:PAAR domain-containing protein [Spirosoma terrae]NDU96738.1 type VI secretion protein [Spirosoma terrae]